MKTIDRIKAQIEDFNRRHPELAVTLDHLTVAQSTRRQGHSLYAHTDTGIGFEEHFLEGESMAEALGNTVH